MNKCKCKEYCDKYKVNFEQLSNDMLMEFKSNELIDKLCEWYSDTWWSQLIKHQWEVLQEKDMKIDDLQQAVNGIWLPAEVEKIKMENDKLRHTIEHLRRPIMFVHHVEPFNLGCWFK
jgi:hypothetical protein